MLIEQTHFPLSGPNWSKIILISLTCIAIGVIAYKVIAPAKIIAKLKTKEDEGKV
jgi:hypothetical protein